MNQEAYFPIQFPLILSQSILVYQEQYEGQGQWSEAKYLEFQIPTKWDQSGESTAHRSIFILNQDIVKHFVHLNQNERESQFSVQEHNQVNNDNGICETYQKIYKNQKSLFIMTDYNQRAEVLLTYSTDVHYCNHFSKLSKKPYEIPYPDGVNLNDYKLIYFKRQSEKDGMTVDVIGISKEEPKIDQIIAFILQQIVYEMRYSKEGITKQIEDSVERVFILVLKRVLRYIGKVLNINFYSKLKELAYEILILNRIEFIRIFSMRNANNQLFCTNLRILKSDINSIVYKLIISEGLFPIQCEINTMDDSWIKLKLFGLISNSEVLPWSPKFHASLAVGQQHYSFTPNDLFNLRTLRDRKYNKNYQYIRIRVLDFFPLDSWIDQIANFFHQNLYEILNYLSDHLTVDIPNKRSTSEEEQKQRTFTMQTKTILLREPLIKMQEKIDETSSVSSRSMTQHKLDPHIVSVFKQNKKYFLTNQKETELISDQRSNQIQSDKTRTLSYNFPSDIQVFGNSSLYQDNPNNEDSEKTQQFIFKKLLKRSLQRVVKKQKHFDIFIEIPFIQLIKSRIAEEFYLCYNYELQATQVLDKFCQIITETELRSYSTLMNNCQTPVAAFIYTLCDTFRPYSENLQINNINEEIESRSRSRCIFDISPIVSNNNLEQVFNIQQRNNFTNTPLNLNLLDRLVFLRFGSIINRIINEKNLIEPAILDHTLDYFGFYGDRHSCDYLKKVQVMDQQLFDFDNNQQEKKQSSLMRRFSDKQDPLVKQTFDEVQQFTSTIFQNQELFFENYSEIMDIYQNQNEDFDQELKSILDKLPINFRNSIDQKKSEKTAYHIHNLLLTQQRKLIKLKQIKEKQAYVRHREMELFQEICYIYYNSIRIQVAQKHRRNTLSYIGFMLAKDLDTFNTEIPENITLQTPV